jgi:hypothetical protein
MFFEEEETKEVEDLECFFEDEDEDEEGIL